MFSMNDYVMVNHARVLDQMIMNVMLVLNMEFSIYELCLYDMDYVYADLIILVI